MSGERGFYKCRQQVRCLYKDLDLKPLGFFKTCKDGVLEGSDDSDFESGASGDEGDCGAETEANKGDDGDGEDPNIVV